MHTFKTKGFHVERLERNGWRGERGNENEISPTYAYFVSVSATWSMTSNFFENSYEL